MKPQNVLTLKTEPNQTRNVAHSYELTEGESQTERMLFPRIMLKYEPLSHKKRNSPDLFNQRLDNHQGYYATPSPMPMQCRAISVVQMEQRVKSEKRAPERVNRHKRTHTDTCEGQCTVKVTPARGASGRLYGKRIAIEKLKLWMPEPTPLEDLNHRLNWIYRRNNLDRRKLEQILRRVQDRSDLNNIIALLKHANAAKHK